jgi:hypothetical protein
VNLSNPEFQIDASMEFANLTFIADSYKSRRDIITAATALRANSSLHLKILQVENVFKIFPN